VARLGKGATADIAQNEMMKVKSSLSIEVAYPAAY
jgi:hypothetical protein